MPLRALALAVLQAVVLKCRGGVALPLAFVVAVQGLPTGLTTSFSLKSEDLSWNKSCCAQAPWSFCTATPCTRVSKELCARLCTRVRTPQIKYGFLRHGWRRLPEFPESFRKVSGKLSGKFPEGFRSFRTKNRKVSGKVSGKFPESFRKSSRKVSGKFLESFRKIFVFSVYIK